MKITPYSTSLGRIIAAVSGSLVLAAGITQVGAADRTWNGGGDQTSWTDAANWGGTAPVAGDALFFGGSTGLTPNNNFAANTIFHSITFNGGAQTFVLSGNAINLTNNVAAGVITGVTNNSANPQTISLNIILNGTNRYWSLTGDVTNSGSVNSAGASQTAPRIIKSGLGTLTLNGATDNAFLAVSVNEGKVVLAKTANGALGGYSAINSGGTMVIALANQIFNRTRLNVEGGTLQVQANELIHCLSSTNVPAISYAGVVENGLANTTNTLTVGSDNGAPKGVYNGTIRDGLAAGNVLNLIATRGSLVQTLNGTNTYTGTTAITGSGAVPTRLLANGAHIGGGAYAVSSSGAGLGTLGGSGSISASVVNINGNGAISPGGFCADGIAGLATITTSPVNYDTNVFSDTTAILTFSNAVNLTAASSTLEVQLNGTTAGTSYDQVNIAGSGTFSNNSANLKFALLYTPATGDKFTLVKVSGTNSASNVGVFATLGGVATDLSQGAIFIEPSTGKRFQISYRAEGSTFDAGAGNGNDIMLQVLSDPLNALTWRGNGTDNNWDINTTANWWNGTNLVTFNNHPVVFDDSGTNNIPVNLSADVTPTTFLFNATKDYVIAGTGKLTGTVVLTKTNSGTLTFITENDNAGSTILRSGVLQIGTNGTSGKWSGTLTVNSNGVLAHKRSDDVVSDLTFSGNGAFVHSGSGALILTNTIPFTGKATNTGGTLQLGDGTSALGSFAGDINLGSAKQLRYLYNGNATIANTFSGNGTVVWDNPDGNFRTYAIPTTAVSSNFTGTNVLASGIRVQAMNDNLGYPLGNASVVIVTNGSQIYLDRSGVAYNQSYYLSGTGWTGEAPGFGYGALRIFQNTISGPITLGSDVRVGGSSLGGTISGPINGGANQLEIYGDNIVGFPFVLSLSNPTNRWGNTLVTFGSLRATAQGAISTNAMTIDLNGQLHVFGTTVSVNSLQNGPNGGGVVYNMSGSAAGTLAVGADGTSTSFDGTFGDGSSRALNLTKVGAGTLTLSAASTNTGTVTVNGGTLALTGAGSFANASNLMANATLDVTGIGGTLTLGSSQTLGGSGNVAGEVVAPAGSIVAPGASVGTLTVSGNVSLGGQLLMELNRTNAPFNCDRLVSSGGTITYGGSLLVTNIGPALQVNNTFQLFPSGVPAYTGNTTLATTDASGATYTWQNDIATLGSVKVLSVTGLVNTTPTNIVTSVSGGNLNLSWPSDHTGWSLQTQTNVLGVGLSTNWITVPGSTATNAVSIPISPANPAVFFRLQYP